MRQDEYFDKFMIQGHYAASGAPQRREVRSLGVRGPEPHRWQPSNALYLEIRSQMIIYSSR